MAPSTQYGTLSSESQRHERLANGADEENAALLGTSDSDGLLKRLHRHVHTNVSTEWADLALLGCYVITGLLDSSSIFAWGAFVSMQTGNTIYLGLGIVAPSEDDRWLRSLVSILAFWLGSFCFARYHRYFSARERWVVVSSYGIQWLLVIVAAVMVTAGPDQHSSGPFTAWVGVPIALVAFQSGGQAVISRVLKYNSLTSVVLTSIYCDLAADEQLFAGLWANPERNRRVAAPVLLLIGALVGGLWARSEIEMAGALWTAVVLKLFVIIAWFFWPAEKSES